MAKANKRVEQSDKCTGCGVCVSICPVNVKLEKKDENFDPDTAELAIMVEGGKAAVVDETCIKCGACVRICPVESLSMVEISAE